MSRDYYPQIVALQLAYSSRLTQCCNNLRFVANCQSHCIGCTAGRTCQMDCHKSKLRYVYLNRVDELQSEIMSMNFRLLR